MTPEERVEQLRPLIAIRARELASGRVEVADLEQEGCINVWEVASQHPDKPREYLSAASAMRMREVARRQNWTGQPSQRGKASVDPLRRNDRDSLDDPDFTPSGLTDGPDWGSVGMARHQAEVAEAVAALPPKQRRFIGLRFWDGYTPAEIQREHEIDKWPAWSGAKANLTESLAHLRTAA